MSCSFFFEVRTMALCRFLNEFRVSSTSLPSAIFFSSEGQQWPCSSHLVGNPRQRTQLQSKPSLYHLQKASPRHTYSLRHRQLESLPQHLCPIPCAAVYLALQGNAHPTTHPCHMWLAPKIMQQGSRQLSGWWWWWRWWWWCWWWWVGGLGGGWVSGLVDGGC